MVEWKKIKNAREKFKSYKEYKVVPEEIRKAINKLLILKEMPNLIDEEELDVKDISF